MTPLRRNLYYAAQCGLLAAALGTTAWTSRASDWHPLPLVVLLFALVLIAHRLIVRLRDKNSLTASFVAFTLAMVLLGPGPAVLFGTTACTLQAISRRLKPQFYFTNIVCFATFLTSGGLLSRVLLGNLHRLHQTPPGLITFALVTLGIFLVTNFLNFLLIAIDTRVVDGDSMNGQIRDMFLPVLPGQMAMAALAAMLATAYTKFGYPALLGMIILVVIFQYLMVALLRSEERADQLEARSIRLASLQLGVLVTLVETLALRDKAAARHAAAVARLSRALAQEAGCSETEQDIVHSAGLLHDIGKFALPDRLLHTADVSQSDLSVIRRHPQEGANLVGRLDGYGPVADVILHHHERTDGTGYPVGLIRNEIPLLSRVLAIANAYDNLIARDGTDPLMAMAELRSMAGTQLDGEFVEHFIRMLGREGQITCTDVDADFETELAFERRARLIAQPA